MTVEYDFNTKVTSEFALYTKWEGKLEHQKDLQQETPVTFTWNDSLENAKDIIKNAADTTYDKTNNYLTSQMNIVPTNISVLESTFDELQTVADTYEYSMAFDNTVKNISLHMRL